MERNVNITSSKAYQIVMEDSITCFFIKTSFSYPEQMPKISSLKWISKEGNNLKWNVEIIEKSTFSINGNKGMNNIALVEVDALSGKIINRQFFRNIFDQEYEEYKRARKARLENSKQ